MYRNEVIDHIRSGYNKLVEQYKSRHDWVGKVIHSELYKGLEFSNAN